MLSGVFPDLARSSEPVGPEQVKAVIGRQLVSAVCSAPSDTLFGSVIIGAFPPYLPQFFGHLDRPVVTSVLAVENRFVLSSG